MMSAGSSMKMPLVFAGLIVIGVMAMVMYEFFAIARAPHDGLGASGRAVATVGDIEKSQEPTLCRPRESGGPATFGERH